MTHISGAADWAPAHYKYDTRKSSGSGPDIWDHNILWQPLIQRVTHPLRRDRGVCIKYCHISQGMDPGIRPAGADHLNVLARQLPDRPVQHFFNCHTIRLDLPAAIIRAVIGNGQSDSFHFSIVQS